MVTHSAHRPQGTTKARWGSYPGSGAASEQQIPDAVPESLTALFELGHRAKLRSRHIAARGIDIGVTLGGGHHLEHRLGVVLPVCGQVQQATDFELAAKL